MNSEWLICRIKPTNRIREVANNAERFGIDIGYGDGRRLMLMPQDIITVVPHDRTALYVLYKRKETNETDTN